ncbi:MAG: imidazole glycerol phosphate synthase subunit HisH [Deltaproteobacteria bacterium HGW-Deltaproteobacteria-12]|jgi:glutamine amidotransferase|nr:MAG: imidazole glycerol phosphate synthase subunit HisH [Deltaproteobacteria bacterium HGW-Deltaproteobacteria-12]
MIGIINYGLGNIKAFANIYNRLGIPFRIVSAPDDLQSVAKIILPGVGAFDLAIQLLEKSGLRQSLDEIALTRGLPVLGVCVGMQIMANSSQEGELSGLGWIAGEVKKFDPSKLTSATHLPHMGWNNVQPVLKNGLLKNMDSESRFYFLHSYYFHCRRNDDVLAVTDYGGPFASAIASGNIFGVQFHPEKSHQWGIQLLKNFAEM